MGISSLIVSITKFSILIGSPRAYLSSSAFHDLTALVEGKYCLNKKKW